MNDKKICFIACVNDDREFEECLLYMKHLVVPIGIEVELLEIKEACSMAAGYMEGMLASDAKYKVYLHQDARIVNLNFIGDILKIFQDDSSIGMIGMVGSKNLPADGVMWHGERIGESFGGVVCESNYDILNDKYTDVEAVDGFLMVTQYDLPWREDLFEGWDFYDISQCMEFQKQGYRVVVPNVERGWCVHEEKSSLALWNYNQYRKIFLKNYTQYMKKSRK